MSRPLGRPVATRTPAGALPTPPRVVFGRDGHLVTLSTEIFLPHPRTQVFPFFADAFNLEAITPPLLHFAVLTPPPITMASGLRIDYRLRLHGLPLRWQSEISVWEPPRRFVDEQRRGPYQVWIHEHTFMETAGGTHVRDVVRYAVPGGGLIERLIVRPRLAEIFRYRQERIAAIFAAGPPAVLEASGPELPLSSPPPPLSPSRDSGRRETL